MTIEIKDLKQLFKLCRQQGVTEIKLDTIEVKFGELPSANQVAQAQVESDNPYANFPDGDLTPEQLMFYSSGGLPENDPALKETAT